MESAEFDKRYDDIFLTYNNVISPFIIQFEVLDAEFPIAVLNEIRAIMGHISKINASNDEAIREDNLLKAERHVKRAVIDCYKYTCISYHDEYEHFCRMYKGVDFSDIQDGKFLNELVRLRKNALNTLKEAKEYEILPEATDDMIYQKYELAYQAYFDLYDYIQINYELVERAKHKNFKRKLFDIISLSVGIAGFAAAIIQFFI